MTIGEFLISVGIGFWMGFGVHGLIRSIVDFNYGSYGFEDVFKPRKRADRMDRQ